MYGAILGDMVGAPYEFDRGNKSKDFEMWNRRVRFTDDTVMTIAVADAILTAGKDSGEKEIKEELVKRMQAWGRKYPNSGYGGRFVHWLGSRKPKPYGSYGNGSAMRVSSVGWLYDTIEKTREVARWTAEVTHNHPEGIKGAEATAVAIFMARTGATKDEIKEYIVKEFGYDLSRTCDEIRPGYYHDESCQKTVPEAISAFLEGQDFEDVIRTAVSLGGDCDTLTCIAGGMAEAFYGVPAEMMEKTLERLGDDMIKVISDFDELRSGSSVDPFLEGNAIVTAAIDKFSSDLTNENLSEVIKAICMRDKHNLPPYAYGVVKIFYLCEIIGGGFVENIETSESRFFSIDECPPLAEEKCSEEQVRMCFEAYHRADDWTVLFD